MKRYFRIYDRFVFCQFVGHVVKERKWYSFFYKYTSGSVHGSIRGALKEIDYLKTQ
jgi:hypothetical protein